MSKPFTRPNSMKRLHILTLCFAVMLLLVHCHNQQTGEVVSKGDKARNDKYAPYVEGNKKILRWETEEMELFIERYGWKMQRTGTGLYLEVLEPGTGECLREGDIATLDYQTFLLSGECIYSSDKDGTKQFTVDRSEEIDALHEAVKLLKPGAKARLVIPSHLAYGVAGDGNKVIGRQPLAMTITVL